MAENILDIGESMYKGNERKLGLFKKCIGNPLWLGHKKWVGSQLDEKGKSSEPFSGEHGFPMRCLYLSPSITRSYCLYLS